jgi:hypothetical protein
VREVIFLVVSPTRVERMTKNLPQLSRGEIPVKVTVEVAPSAFREPVIERRIEVVDWRDGIDIADVDFHETFITEAEAEIIRARRMEMMAGILAEHGWKIERPLEPEEPDAAPSE